MVRVRRSGEGQYSVSMGAERGPPAFMLEDEPVAVSHLGSGGQPELERRPEWPEGHQPHRALPMRARAVGCASGLRAAAIDGGVQHAAQQHEARVLVAQPDRRGEARASARLRRRGQPVVLRCRRRSGAGVQRCKAQVQHTCCCAEPLGSPNASTDAALTSIAHPRVSMRPGVDEPSAAAAADE